MFFQLKKKEFRCIRISLSYPSIWIYWSI